LQVDRDDEVQAPTKTEACYNIEGRVLLEALLTATAPAQAARLAQRLTKDRKTDWDQMAVTLRANREEPAQK
ncbi:MAG: hypothetical protein ACKO19_02060, partial [Betaproteobacteria bacterium]